MSLKNLWQSWCEFFFKPVSTEGVAAFRILWFTMLFFSFLFDLTNIEDFYGPKGLISLATVREQFPAIHLNIFHLTGVELPIVYTVFTLWGIALIFSILGFYTRYSMIAVLICMVSVHQRNIWLLSSAEVLMRLITILLVCSPAGNSLSVDSLLGRKFALLRKPKQWAPWAMRLIQLQTSVVYIWTVWHKLKGANWPDGTALYYATRLEALKNVTLSFMLDSMFFIKTLTWSTLVIELALAILLWFKETRWPTLIIGILFHLGIEFTMSIPFFEIVMMCLILSFIPEDTIATQIASLKRKLCHSVRASNVSDNLKAKLLWIAGENL